MDDDLTVAFVRLPNATPGDTSSPAPAAGAPSPAGSQEKWGSFELLARVGSGGFGEVYRAWDPNLQREVALKLLLPSLIDSEAEYQEVLREARALAAVRHNNVVPVYGIDRHDGRVGFWTDFVHGSTLSALLAAQGPLGYREAALIGIDVAHALSAVHRSGMLHRDIKAENVMREEGGRILLMDFGLSALPQQGGHGIAGTPSYMAPELFTGSPASVSTDLYAVGVLLFYLVTGKYPVPFLGYSKDQLAEAQSQRLFLPDLRPDLPASFLRTVAVAMDHDPHKRFASAGQLSGALNESLGMAPAPELVPATAPIAVAPVAAQPWYKTISPRALRASILVLALVFGKPLYNKIMHSGPVAPPSSPTQAPGTSTNNYDEYQKAQDLVVHSYLQRNLAAAVDGFNKVLANDPQFALAEAGLGSAYFLQYRRTHNLEALDKAQAATKRALELDPNNAPAYVTLARISTINGQTALAMEQAQHALTLDPRSAEAFAAEADVFAAQGRSEDAKKALNKAIDIAPDDWRFPVLLGNYEFDAGNIEQAVVLYQRGVELAPDNAIAYYNLGDTQLKLGRFDEAQKSFEKALKIEPRFAYYSALGSLLSMEGKHDEAISMEKHAVELNPDDYNTLENLAEAYLWSPEGHQKAVETSRKVITLAETARTKSPRDAELLIVLAQAYAIVGEKARSLSSTRQALALQPNDPNINQHAGEIYEMLGDRATAISLIAKALASGYSAALVDRNPQLAALKSDPAFAQGVTKAKADLLPK